MSVQAMSWVIEKGTEKGSRFVVLLMIANHCDAQGRGCFASIERLARESRISQRHVIRVLEQLEKKGSIRNEGVSKYGTNTWSIPCLSTPDNNAGNKVVSLRGDNLSPDIHVRGEMAQCHPSLPEPCLSIRGEEEQQHSGETTPELLSWMKQKCRTHIRTRKLRWPKIQNPSEFTSQERAIGSSEYRQAFLDWLDHAPRPNVFSFVAAMRSHPAVRASNGNGRGPEKSMKATIDEETNQFWDELKGKRNAEPNDSAR